MVRAGDRLVARQRLYRSNEISTEAKKWNILNLHLKIRIMNIFAALNSLSVMLNGNLVVFKLDEIVREMYNKRV